MKMIYKNITFDIEGGEIKESGQNPAASPRELIVMRMLAEKLAGGLDPADIPDIDGLTLEQDQ